MRPLLAILVISVLGINQALSQVGIGTTNPTATFHVVGTTIPGNTGGTTELLNQNFDSYTITEINSSIGCSVDGWETTTTGDASANCNSCAGTWIFIDSDETGCSQNSTAIVNFVANPASTVITISFDYRYNDYLGADDFFRAYLFNNTTNSQVGADLVNITTDQDTSYNGTVNVTAGDNYSLRFEYQGIFDFGASVDNILVTETTTAVTGSYAFRLEDGQQQDGYVLTSDADGNGTWQPSNSVGGTDNQTISISGNQLSIENGNTVTLPTGSGSYIFENGISETSGNVRLGGTLIQNTTIALDDNDLTFTTSNTAAFPGDIIFEGNLREVMETNLEDNYINFGGGFPLVDGDDGSTFLDSGSSTFTKDFVAGFDAGSTGGTAVAMGSIEYFVDGTDELFFEGSGFSPMDDETSQFGNTLGKSNRRWGAVYATNGVITTSDETYKKEIQNLEYGLEEILKIKTISYKWKDQTLGKTDIPNALQARKIGFSAQNLLEILPEVVQTHSWVAKNEDGTYVRVKNNKLGVYYSDIIPVAIKAIQQQQEQIDELKNTVALLIKQNKHLESLIKNKN
ncbi:hypothetical protein BWZ20_03885 [Winogradskyella sp. J14-2]|uniref:tail fiber domain-containing protein n=1 Tax=Winogradskyella sp. J14-2 TaxID=1936080 RepID=UPI000972A5B5|nr:tail fiber domain-containing protein [Winogradskyella sp. J14-2]APY07488.1 hypothetical protein BWZ20_03885 [Winogradskyella sp. J14-2]